MKWSSLANHPKTGPKCLVIKWLKQNGFQKKMADHLKSGPDIFQLGGLFKLKKRLFIAF
jgi:hypothetical protein